MDDHFETARLEAFSDGVFAIAITLLVLELSVPEDDFDDLLAGSSISGRRTSPTSPAS